MFSLEFDSEFGLKHLLSLAAASHQTQSPIHVLEMNLTSLILALQNVTHLSDTSLDRVVEWLEEFCFEKHAFINSLEWLLRLRIHLCNVQDAIRESLHGDFEIVSL